MSQELVESTGGAISLSNLPEELQKKIKEAGDKLKASSAIKVNKIRLDDKNYIFPDGTEIQTFTGIIVGVKHANMHYPGEYEEGVVNPVDCFAIMEGSEDVANKDLQPHTKVVSKYSSSCGSCAKFLWGSDRRGKGKECAEYALLAIAVPSLGDTLYLLEEKKANAKTVDGYIRNITDKYGHPIAVLTEFSIGKKAKWVQEFTVAGGVDTAVLQNLAGRIDEANHMLTERVTASYDNRNDTPEIIPEVGVVPPVREARSRK